jgi:predicted AAA+ superfamily ATPase
MKNIQRNLPKTQKRSFFLFGPRGVGKSTWLKDTYPDSFRINLLDTSLSLKLQRDPHLLESLIPPNLKTFCIIDEVQKIPSLLDEVHRLIEDKRILFILSGSSARKLKKSGANLLAGRASVMNMESFSAFELKSKFKLQHALEFGTLPLVYQKQGSERDILEAYVHTYLKEEIKEEGLVRKVEPFVRFLEVAGRFNAQILNIENISREAAAPRASVQGYFDILYDTLIGHRLPAYRPGGKVREVHHSKFYFFDVGVARACADNLRSEPDTVAAGYLFETLMFHELRVYNEISGKKFPIYYYRSGAGSEIDFVIETEKKGFSSKAQVILIECKSSKRWDRKWEKPIRSFGETQKVNVKKKCGIYCGSEKLNFDGFAVFPFTQFIESLYAGDIF